MAQAARRSARPADLVSGMMFEGAVAATGFLSRHPASAGAVTAFAIAFLFVSANALWYQPYRHPAPFFATQTMAAADPGEAPTEMRVVRAADIDPEVERVQRALTDLNLYTGSIDGISGPRTRQAIEAYRRRAGLGGAPEIDAALLESLDRAPPRPTPAPRDPAEPDERVAEAQGALAALGYKNIDIDGLLGARTRSAIRDFRQRNGLGDDADVDAALLDALRRARRDG